MKMKDRVTLGVLQEADMEGLRALVVNEEIKKTYMLPDLDTLQAQEKLCRRLQNMSLDEAHFVRGIYLDGQLAGFLNDVEMKDGCVEVGYVVHPGLWNKGIATCALRLAIGQLMEKGFHTVRAGHFEMNAASGRVMEKAGMIKIPDTDTVEYRGKTHLCIYYEMKA